VLDLLGEGGEEMRGRSAFLERLAKRSPQRERHASVVMRGGAVLSFGFNHDGLHAEEAALRKLWPSERRGTTLISFRLTRGGVPGMALPCSRCMRLLHLNGVRKVVFSNREGRFETCCLNKRK
jgi:hypothetical protein